MRGVGAPNSSKDTWHKALTKWTTASPSNLVEPVKILSTATTTLWDEVSPMDSLMWASFFCSPVTSQQKSKKKIKNVKNKDVISYAIYMLYMVTDYPSKFGWKNEWTHVVNSLNSGKASRKFEVSWGIFKPESFMYCGFTPVPISWASSSWLMHFRISSHDFPK